MNELKLKPERSEIQPGKSGEKKRKKNNEMRGDDDEPTATTDHIRDNELSGNLFPFGHTTNSNAIAVCVCVSVNAMLYARVYVTCMRD